MPESAGWLRERLDAWGAGLRHDCGPATSNADVCMCVSPEACPVAADRKAIAELCAALAENARMREERERELCHAYGSGWCDAAETVFVGRRSGTSGQEAGWQEYRREMGARIESNATSQQFARDE